MVWFVLSLPCLALLFIVAWDISDRSRFRKKVRDPMVWLTAVLAACTAVSSLLAYFQWKALEQTDNTYWAGQRPWLGIKKATEVRDWRVLQQKPDGQTLNIGVGFDVSNYGNLPATDINIAGTVFATADPGDNYKPDSAQQQKDLAEFEIQRKRMMTTYKALCEPLKFDGTDRFDYSINSGLAPSVFPKETPSSGIFASNTFSNDLKHILVIEMPACLRYSFGEDHSRVGHTYFVLRILARKPARFIDLSKPVSPADLDVELEGSTQQAD